MPSLARKRRAEREDEDDGSPEPATQGRRRTTQNDYHSDEDDTGYGNGNGDNDSNAEQMVKKLVRLALACEYSRQPIRRQTIREKVLGSAGRQFKPVFEQAQLQLRSVFGMEMVELPEKEKVTLAQKRAAKTQSQSQSKTAQSYTLVSLLPAPFHDPAILPPPSIPTQATEAQYTSLYTLLVSLVALSGDELADTKMERYLRRLGLEDHTPIPGYTKTELLLKRMEKEGYLVKVRESAGGQGEEDVSWMVGPRGKVEVGEQGVRGLVKAVYGHVDGHAEAELERRVARSLGLGEAVV
ncbi:hypothetical protein LTR91_009161 [Friedmanniomyces endolithicus]|uniref:MAGE domain-containing protein n=1 Tax=Friedmanniomyces endolithicus TaxID=329885 RepID=A0AAN6KLM4_9PEZI|nr:hypothetical protein LTR94_012923 [Friedmanniomyces endolithicus]KAK0782930.1 hypothetical protein LTR59_011992 [Friedmanniomyces endolithicus]KAK0802665.1 hypothetical protein LTR75_008236 [Friedmanniomyces endolithicus]KAK0803331.1 hypothetical protein LTR38_006191 [Friedmanniomyces endolithicus]KAK0832584.1 hypothetical protein LTR03_015098 [Friedmanniomyces endolithicus]